MKLTVQDLQEKLDQQLRLIHSSIKQFDGGFHDEALHLATNLYNLLYDNNPRKGQGSLLGQLGIKNSLKYYDSRLEIQSDAGIHSTYNGLINTFLGENGGVKMIPMLDENEHSKFIDFDTRRDGTIFIDKNGNKFDRKNIVEFVRSKDGGSHIDGILSKKEFEFMKKEFLGTNILVDGKRECIKQLEYFAIRQMIHELLKSLDNQYTYKLLNENDPGYILGGNASLGFVPDQKVHAIISVGKHEYSIPFF